MVGRLRRGRLNTSSPVQQANYISIGSQPEESEDRNVGYLEPCLVLLRAGGNQGQARGSSTAHWGMSYPVVKGAMKLRHIQ